MVPSSDLLASGVSYSFAEWASTPVPKGPPGVYSIWRGDEILYVGMSWKEPSPTSAGSSSPGLWGRLNQHASGRRSGDQFCVYICDRFVLSGLDRRSIAGVARGEVSLDLLTRDYVREHLAYRFVTTSTGAEARSLESQVRRAGLGACGRPLLNPMAASKET